MGVITYSTQQIQSILDRLDGVEYLSAVTYQEIDDRILADQYLQEQINAINTGKTLSIGELSDVTLTDIQNSDLIIYSGNTFINIPSSQIKPDLTSYATIYYVDSGNTIIQNQISIINNSLVGESYSRISGDTYLLERINSIPLVDTGLTIALSAETVNRISGDTYTQSLINIESILRLSGDTYSQELISNIDLSSRVAKSGDTMTGLLTIDNSLIVQSNIQVGGPSTLSADIVSSKNGNASWYMRNTHMGATPFGGLAFGPAIDEQTVGMISGVGANVGGLQIAGLSNSDFTPLVFSGYVGSTILIPSTSASAIYGWKSDGSGGRVALDNNEKIYSIFNGSTEKVYITGDGVIHASAISGATINISDISGLTNILNTESNNRISGDTYLQGQITVNYNYITGLTYSLSIETTNRISGDTYNLSLINSNYLLITGNTTNINTETTNRISGDTYNLSLINNKVDKIVGKGLSTVDFTDTGYTHTDNNFTTYYLNSITGNTTNINTETTNRISGDTYNLSLISSIQNLYNSTFLPNPIIYTYVAGLITKSIETISGGTIEKRYSYYASSSPIPDGSPNIMEVNHSVLGVWQRVTYTYTTGVLTSQSNSTIIAWSI